MRGRGLALLGAVLVPVAAGCGAGDDSTSTFEFAAPAEGNADRWAEVWCGIDGSMTREDVIELMGEPTSEFDASEAQPQSQWDAGPFDYTVFYDLKGRVEQAQTNQLVFEEEGLAKPFPCEFTRFF